MDSPLAWLHRWCGRRHSFKSERAVQRRPRVVMWTPDPAPDCSHLRSRRTGTGQSRRRQFSCASRRSLPGPAFSATAGPKAEPPGSSAARLAGVVPASLHSCAIAGTATGPQLTRNRLRPKEGGSGNSDVFGSLPKLPPMFWVLRSASVVPPLRTRFGGHCMASLGSPYIRRGEPSCPEFLRRGASFGAKYALEKSHRTGWDLRKGVRLGS